ncbi:unnamed protein product [Rhizoctonia solani]|uniref:Uncharacterized protein n=1 Tax=Rhizoctonia solani TaxID=456999 RepID=A0A8H3C284_9AGAM|nr:unnamed protein product [Rhizoctonia solani]
MRTFNRLSVFAFLLSLGYIVHALPPAHLTGLIAHRQYNTPDHYGGNTGSYGASEDTLSNTGDRSTPGVIDVRGEVWTLKGKLDPKLALLGRCKNMDDAKVQVETIVGIIKEENARLAGISVNLPVEAHMKIARVIIKVFIELVSTCVKLSLKFGAPLVIHDLAEIDAAFSGYLSALTLCVPGLKQVLINLASNMNAEVISDLGVVGLVQCVKLLGLASRTPGVAR